MQLIDLVLQAGYQALRFCQLLLQDGIICRCLLSVKISKALLEMRMCLLACCQLLPNSAASPLAPLDLNKNLSVQHLTLVERNLQGLTIPTGISPSENGPIFWR